MHTSDKPDLKAARGKDGEGWLRSDLEHKVVCIRSLEASKHASWVEVTDADVMPTGELRIGYRRRMLRYNAVQLWENLFRRGWKRVPQQW